MIYRAQQPRSIHTYPWVHYIDWRSLLAFGLPFALYLLTLAPTIYNLDSAELTTAAATGGIVRATGYPLYLVLGHLWSYVPVGDVGYRMNLFSAFSGALTIALAERILRRWQVSVWAIVAALGLLATAPIFWGLSLIAEVYTLHTALMACLILLLLRWAAQPTPWRLAAVAFVAGMSSSHHAATALLVPGCIWFVGVTAPRQVLKSGTLLSAIAALSLGMSAYLYLPLRYLADSAFNYAGIYNANGIFEPVNLLTLEGIWWLVSGKAFIGQMLAYQGYALWEQTTAYATMLWRTFFAIGIGPGIVGIAIVLYRDWRVGGMFTLFFVANAAFYIDYQVIDKETMFLPTYLIWALWVGIGYDWLFTWVWEKTQEQVDMLARHLMIGLATGMVIVATYWNWSLVDLSQDWSTRQRGEIILASIEPDALIFGWWETVPVIEYLQLVENQRPDIQAINRFLISYDDMLLLIERNIDRQPVYIDNPNGEILRRWRVLPVGPIYQLHPRNT